MKRVFAIAAIIGLTACGPKVQDYKSMTPTQKEAFMAKYQKDMTKVHSLANRMGQMKVVYETDAKRDTITSVMTMGIEMKVASTQMAKQVNEMMLEQNCKERFFREFVEAGITYRMIMKDAKGRTMVNTVVSPKNCAKYLKA